MQIIIPCAGLGSRFQEAGYVFPKPIIETLNGKPMIQLVKENINIDGKYIFLFQKQHLEQYQIKYLIKLIEPNSEIIEVDRLTEGAACTVLLAKDKLDLEDELVIANSDQWINWNSKHFLQFMYDKSADGGIVTFHATHPKWSFAKIDEETGLVIEVAEKKPISTTATTGIYYFKKAQLFVEGAEEMIKKNIRTNNEFYVCPVFNKIIQNGGKVYNYPIAEMLGLGTPQDLEKSLKILEGRKSV